MHIMSHIGPGPEPDIIGYFDKTIGDTHTSKGNHKGPLTSFPLGQSAPAKPQCYHQQRH